MMAASKTEDYQLSGDVLDQGLKELGYSREDLSVELFTSDNNMSFTPTAARGKAAATNFTGPLSGWPTGTPGSVNWAGS